MIELRYQFKSEISREIIVRLSNVRRVRGDDSPAPWAVSVAIMWGGEIAFDRPLAGADPLHAIELAAKFAASYLDGRAQDEGGTLEPLSAPP